MNTEVEGELEVGAQVGYRYRIVAMHRAHPLGELYRCIDEETGDRRSLQRLRREFASPIVRTRLFETRGGAALESPEIDDLVDYGEDLDGRLYLVSAWRDEPSLDLIERPLGFDEAVAIIVQVARALASLHQSGYVHGAIEPRSLLVDEQRKLVSLLDFGLVPALDADVHRSKSLALMVSPAYAAPELIRGEALSPASDVYALGVLMWELLLGRPPFGGPTLKILDAHLNRPLPGIEQPFDMPDSFEWVLRRMLAKVASDRFTDASEVVAELEVYLHAPRPQTTQLLALDGEDGEAETLLLTREATELAPVEQPIAGHGSFAAGPEPAPPPRSRRRPRLLAIASGLSCVGVLAVIAFGELTPAARDASEAGVDAPVQAQVQSVERDQAEGRTEPSPAQVQAPIAQPEPAEPEPEIEDRDEASVPQRAALLESSFQAKKRELYRRVDVRCVRGQVRRTVKVKVRVDGEGEVEAAWPTHGMGKTKLGACVARQARKLEFPRTSEGGSYTYTVRIR